MYFVWNGFLYALGERFLQRLRYHRVTGLLDLGIAGLFDAVGKGRFVGSVGDTLASLVLLGGARHAHLFCVVVVVVVCVVLCCFVWKED